MIRLESYSFVTINGTTKLKPLFWRLKLNVAAPSILTSVIFEAFKEKSDNSLIKFSMVSIANYKIFYITIPKSCSQYPTNFRRFYYLVVA